MRNFQLKQGLGLVTLTLLLSFSLSTAGSTFVAEKDRAELRQHLKLAIAQADSFDDRFDAEVWLLDMSGRLTRFMPEPQQRLEFLRLVHREARAAKLDPELVLALIEVESNFDRFAVSSAGAQGLMQVMPFWKAEIGRSDDNLSKVETNLRYGCQILQFYINKEKGGLFRALARYNGSLGKSWYPERVLSRWRKRWYAGEIEGL
ncbi:lytic transglycosylase domain-containing protein [Spongiibacter sp. IMCC21906]|uniref:lytic transglycosylase domain-containing protein n=1 Tax=Spongiibacter sp. IMCC21906 TaxID=1620392 RepID=UPI00062E4110